MVAYAYERQLSRSYFTSLISVVECVLPHVRGRLAYSKSIAKRWEAAQPTKHTTPISFHAAVFLAWVLGSIGHPRVVGLLYLTLACWLASNGGRTLGP